MADNQDSKRTAEAQQDESVFPLGVIRIRDQQPVLIEEHSLGFGERDLMFALVYRVLAVVPLERQFRHDPA
jgi:hypothetical protein